MVMDRSGGGTVWRSRRPSRVISAFAVTAFLAIILAACSSSAPGSSSASSSSGASSSQSAAVKQASAEWATLQKTPTTIWNASLGKFTPKTSGTIYYVACDLSIEGCSNMGTALKAATAAIGYKYQVCAGATPTAISQCFTNAINAKPSAIVTDGTSQESNGADFERVAKAHIPLITSFSGDAAKPSDVTTQIAGGDFCTVSGQVLADAVIAQSSGKADVLYFTESSYKCDVSTLQGFQQEIAKCSTCKLKVVSFSLSTMPQTLPQQVLTELQENPGANWAVGPFDEVATYLTQGVQQSGKTSSVKVASLYGYSPNLQEVRSGGQAIDIMQGKYEQGWAAVDAAARIMAGKPVPANFELNLMAYTKQTAKTLGTAGFLGSKNYQQQFEELWGKSKS